MPGHGRNDRFWPQAAAGPAHYREAAVDPLQPPECHNRVAIFRYVHVKG